MNLRDMLADGNVTIQTIADHLDGLDHAGRMSFMASTSKADQRKLWHLAAGSAPITLEHFVPEGTPARVPVVHHGRNTLPCHKAFQKVFARPEDGSARGFGYNEGSTRWFVGPGYFVLIPCAGNPAWEERGAWVVDYFQVPDGPVPDGWPTLKHNHQGVQVLVYHHTRDFMRKVSEHVSIGMAFKVESSLNNWFTLVRED